LKKFEFGGDGKDLFKGGKDDDDEGDGGSSEEE